LEIGKENVLIAQWTYPKIAGVVPSVAMNSPTPKADFSPWWQ